uniref:Uncharacterized protein n=1 Tax=Arundo donax TaxID=35708 RepID=A0A0A9A971_ARUDO
MCQGPTTSSESEPFVPRFYPFKLAIF